MVQRLRKSRVLAAGYIIATVAVAGYAAADAMANAFARSDPVFATRIQPSNPAAVEASISDRLTGATVQTKVAEANTATVRAALRLKPLSPVLLRTMGVQRDLARDPARARAFMQMGLRTSRRDLLTQLWMIEDAAAHGTVEQTLGYFDLALTTSANAQILLFPVLSGAIEEPEILSKLMRYVQPPRPWVPAFLGHAAENAPPDAVAALLRKLPDVRTDPELRQRARTLLGRMAASGDFAAARDFSVRTMGARPKQLVDLQPGAATTARDFAPLTWQLGDQNGVDTLLEAGQFRISTNAGNAGTALNRMLLLAPGRYDFLQTLSYPESGAITIGSWQWRCVNQPAPFSVLDLPARSGSYRTSITVPPGCSAIRLELKVGSIDAGAREDMTITRLRLTSLEPLSPKGSPAR